MKEEHEKLRAKYLTEYIYEKHNQDKCLGFIDGFEKAIQVLSQSEWISVEDSLPEIDTSNKWNNDNKITKDVLCYSKEWGMKFGRYFHLAGFWTVNGVTSSKGIDVEFWKEINQPQTK